MKTRFTQQFLMAFLMMGLFTASQAQTYVNGSATGANDGSSWADAYTDLSAALGATAGGDLWIASGTYKPADTGLDSFNTFMVMNPINIYGGFAGTEATIDDRVAGNVTILSGDVAGDDVDNDFATNREDNLSHVVSIDVGASDVVIMDGLTVSGGDAHSSAAPDDTYIYAGGAIYTVSTLEINNCNFNNNFAASGGSVYFVGNADDSKIDNSVFERNSATSQSCGAMANSIDGFTVTNSEFNDHTGVRGGLYPLRVTDLLIDNCTFTNNVNADGFGGAMFIWNSVGVISNCVFTGNSASNGAGFYYDGRELADGLVGLTLDNCTFEGNSVIGRGGAINVFDAKFALVNCTFNNNEAIDIGGAILFASCDYTMDGCTFNGNMAAGNGGAIFEFGLIGNQTNNTFRNNNGEVGGAINFQGGNFTCVGNTFDSNNSLRFGGAVFSGFGSITSFTDCVFEDNQSDDGPAGALWLQSDTTAIIIEGSEFNGNSSGGAGGAIGMFGPIPMNINNSSFIGNSAEGFGGAINGSEQSADEPGEATITITNTVFNENTTEGQGAGFSFIDYDVELANCEFSLNINGGEGAGGAISLNATDTSTVNININHSTFVNNFGLIGAGIATFTGELDSKLNVSISNSILANPLGTNYQVEGGSPKFSSLGGNVSTDDTAIDNFTNTNDVNEADIDAVFEDYEDGNYELAEGSPAVGIALASNVGSDLNGKGHIGLPDAGCYESDFIINSVTVLENNGQLAMTPNPAATETTITIDNAWTGVVNMVVTDMTGKVVSNQDVNKTAQTQEFNLNVSELSEGNYILSLRAEDAIVSTQFIKI